LEALEAEKIRYVIIGMSAVIAQGVATTTWTSVFGSICPLAKASEP
jgi:hypothetical protein